MGASLTKVSVQPVTTQSCPLFLAESLGVAHDWGCRDLASASSSAASSGQPGSVSGQRPQEGAVGSPLCSLVFIETEGADGSDSWATQSKTVCLQVGGSFLKSLEEPWLSSGLDVAVCQILTYPPRVKAVLG